MARQRVLGLVLAGGAGTRLGPLTADRAKSAVPFGGQYRVVDFTLSNLVNGGLQRICVLTQYKSHSLNRHITTTWQLNSLLDNYVTAVPAQQRLGPRWQAGSADAIYQSLNLIYSDRPDLVVVVGADHVYRMDPRQMIEQHVAWGAGATVAAIPVARPEAADFGVVQAAPDGHLIEAFLEKSSDPPGRPGQPDEALVSMGNYVFDTDVLVEALRKDAADDASGHSIGGDVIPMLVRERAAHVYDFLQNKVPGAEPGELGYWREVGTIDSYFDAHMDLCAIHPAFSLHNRRWPILTQVPSYPPAKFVHDDGPGRTGAQQPGQQRRRRLRRAGARLGPVAGSPGRQRVPGEPVGDLARFARRPPGRRRERHPGQERRGRGGRHGRGGQGAGPGPRAGGVQRRHHRGRQGPVRAGLTGDAPAACRWPVRSSPSTTPGAERARSFSEERRGSEIDV